MLDIRRATEADLEAVASIAAFSFNSEPRGPSDRSVSGTLCATYAGDVVGTARAYELQQWFGGKRVPCAGVAAVAVLPEHRGRGIAGAMVRELLALRRAAGDAVSALYPANSQLYRKLGYEYAGLNPKFLVSVQDLPASRPAAGLEARSTTAGVADLRACFSRFAAGYNGPVEWEDAGHWALSVLAHEGEGLHQRTVVVPGDGGPKGYASYFTAYDAERQAVVATCKHFIALEARALGALLGYFRRFENSAGYLAWPGPPNGAPVGLAASANGFAVVSKTSRWMLRILDVPRALEARGYPAGAQQELTFGIHDDIFEANAGPWRLKVAGGQASVEAASGSAGPPLPIGPFSALYSGFVNPSDLVALGVLDPGDPRASAFAEIFAGPTPWMPDSI